MMLLSYVLIILVVMAAVFERCKLPASSGAILIGAVLGGFFRLARVRESDMLVHASFITFDEELFLYMLLPPIIFEAGCADSPTTASRPCLCATRRAPAGGARSP